MNGVVVVQYDKWVFYNFFIYLRIVEEIPVRYYMLGLVVIFISTLHWFYF